MVLTVFTVSFSVVVVCFVLSFVLVSFVLGGDEEDSFEVLDAVDFSAVVVSFVVLLGVVDCTVVVDSDVDFCVASLDIPLLSCVSVIEGSVAFISVSSKCVVGVATVAFAVEFTEIEVVVLAAVVAFDLTSVAFCVEVTLAVVTID